jgi:hypothetical protein
MFSFAKKAALATALAATALTSVTPAMAQGYPYGGGYHNRNHGDTTGAAIVGGIVGIALGALIASSGNRDHNRYRDCGWQWRDGYYWDRGGHRYDRNGRPCDEQRGSYYSGGGQDYGNDYYGRRGYRDGDGYRDGESYRGSENYRGGYRGY